MFCAAAYGAFLTLFQTFVNLFVPQQTDEGNRRVKKSVPLKGSETDDTAAL